MKDLLTDEVRKLPSSPIPAEAVIGAGRRRLWRRRAVGATATFAAVTALAFVAPLVAWPDGGDGEATSAGAFEERAVTYVTGSTIHYGDREIDVSPHQVWSFVQTDDGFVFTTEGGEVYLADGKSVDQIGDHNGLWSLAADDTGSYVGWLEYGAADFGTERPEFVVYDTSTRSEVLRTSEGNVSGVAVHGGRKAAEMEDIDGDIAYVHDAEGVTAWNLTDGTSKRIASSVGPDWLWGVADGQIAHVEADGQRRYVVVSEDPRATQPRTPLGWEPLGAKLSPTGKHVVAVPPPGDLVVTEMPSQRDVTPDDSRYDKGGLAPLQWVSDDVFYSAGTPRGGEWADVVRCTISTGSCRVVVEAVAPAAEIQGPDGDNSLIQ